MRRSFLSIASAFTAIVLKAQWCVPTTAVPYSTDMPGITQFTCNTIDRTSADIENFPYNSYVNTGLSTVLEKGITYPVTIGCTIDAVNFPGSHMSLRVWVDFNHDGQLDDVGETLLSTDHAPGPAFNGNISIPTDAMTGPTRLRVTAKMCNHTGHSAPTPCDMPADPIGYHGELEDYTVDIIEAVGVEELEPSSSLHIVGTATATTFSFGSKQAAAARVEILDATGRVMEAHELGQLPAGEHTAALAGIGVQGMYIGRLWLNGRAHAVRFLR